MTRWSVRARLLSLCLLAVQTSLAAFSVWLPVRGSHAGDRNGDGRPDFWRTYDASGHLAQLALDSNFDGLADVREYYDRGVLVRRDSDRDFNDRVDLVQNFDARTHQILRAVTDVDFDGTADVLVLFQDGQPVYSKLAQRATPVSITDRSAPWARDRPGRTADEPLTPLVDPFLADRALTAIHITAPSADSAVFDASVGMPSPGAGFANPLVLSSIVSRRTDSRPSSTAAVPYSPRGPPLSPLHS